MEPFKIQLLESHFTVEPQDNGTYRVMEGQEKIAVIYPEAMGDQVI